MLCSLARALSSLPAPLGYQCWKSGGTGRVSAMNWFHSQSGRVKPRAEEAPASASTEGKECSPQTFNYPIPDGKYREIKVSSAKEAQVIAEHFHNDNYTALAAFEECE